MSANWTPESTLERVGPDEWVIFDHQKRIAVVRQLSIGPRNELVYRAVTWAARSEDRVLLGYLSTLSLAAGIVWREYLAAESERRGRVG